MLWRAPLATCRWGSLRLDAGLPNDCCPCRDFGLDLGGAVIGGAGARLEAKGGQTLLHVRQCDDLDDLAIEQRDDIARCSGRDENGLPTLAFDGGVAGFGQLENLGQAQCDRPRRMPAPSTNIASAPSGTGRIST